VIAVAVAIPIFAFGQGGGAPSLDAVAGDSLGVVDSASGKIRSAVGVGASRRV